MTTFYLDYEGGSDAADGTSFANRWKTFELGATAARIAPSDEIRVMASLAPTSLGITATWTDGPLPAAYSIVSSTNATPIVVTLSSGNYTAMAPAVDDTVTLYGHTVNTKANGTWKISAVNGSTTVTLVNADGTNSVGNGVGGATGSIRKGTNRAVILASPLVASVACLGNQGTKGNWTASANVTASVLTSDFREGGECQSLAIAAGFTTGMAAYFATGTLNLSGYQQLSFWIKQTVGTLGAAGAVTISLCSDTAGATPVNTFNVPITGTLNQWMPVTIDLVTNLGASIQSIAFNVVTDNGAQTFLLDNIIACKASSSADSLSLTSLIGKNTAGETFYGIQSINNVRIMLDSSTNILPNIAAPSRGYSGTTETVTTYKRETIKTVPAAATTTMANKVTDSGSVGLVISYTGGWDRTNMSSQSGETWFDGGNGYGLGISGDSSRSFLSFDKISLIRYNQGINFTLGSNISILSGSFNNNTLNGIYSNQVVSVTIGTIIANCNTANGINVSSGSNNSTAISITANGNGTVGASYTGAFLAASQCTYQAVTTKNNHTYGVHTEQAGNIVIKNMTTSGNGTNAIRVGGANSGGSNVYLYNPNMLEATPIIQTTFANSRLSMEKYSGVIGDNRIQMDIGLISSQTAVRHTASGYAWSMAVSSTNATVTYPLYLPVAKVACAASALVTIKAWMRRSNTGLTLRLMCKGGQIAGVSADVSSSMTAVADTWEELTITFTPSEAGVVEITAEAYGGTTYTGYVDDLTIWQV